MNFGAVGEDDGGKLPREAIRLEPVQVCLAGFYMIDALCEVERTYMFVLSMQLLTFSIEQKTNAPCKRKTNFP